MTPGMALAIATCAALVVAACAVVLTVVHVRTGRAINAGVTLADPASMARIISRHTEVLNATEWRLQALETLTAPPPAPLTPPAPPQRPRRHGGGRHDADRSRLRSLEEDITTWRMPGTPGPGRVILR